MARISSLAVRILFIHQNFPGQFRHIAPLLARAGHQVMGMGEEKHARRQLGTTPGVHVIGYKMGSAPPVSDAYGGTLGPALRRGRVVAQALAEIRRDKKFTPDVICTHIGWGEAIFVKDVFPSARMLLHCEYFYRPTGSDFGFDPEFRPRPDARLRLRVMNAPLLMALQAADHGIAPTRWQCEQFPVEYQPKISVIHEGIDTDVVRPDANAVFEIPQAGLRLTAADQVVTYTTRNFEPYRGFHIFMRAVPHILRRCPNARIVIVGNDDVSYSMRLPEGDTYRKRAMKEVGAEIDPTRVHFLAGLPFSKYLSLLQISSAHVYLTYPFVLSWSLLEAMSAGCIVIASRTAPVLEVMKDEETGLLVDFFRHEEIAARVEEALSRGANLSSLKERARAAVVESFDLRRRCLPRHVDLIERLGPAGR